uniref:Uncharacterized protein n=1 Tax=Lepeophtheirus salmonis TaxID=72036 RepID=A0A0K2UPI7_LEPSM
MGFNYLDSKCQILLRDSKCISLVIVVEEIPLLREGLK